MDNEQQQIWVRLRHAGGVATPARGALRRGPRPIRRAARAVRPSGGGEGAGRERITMLLENNPYPQDVRVRFEAESLARAGHSVEVIAPRSHDQPRTDWVRGVRVRRFRAFEPSGGGVGAIAREYAVAMLALHAAALRALARGATVLHLHNPPDLLFAAGALFRIAGREVVFDQHDLGPELTAVRYRSPALVALARFVERLTFGVATHVLVPNQSHAELAQSRGGKPPDRVTIVRNGPPADWLALPVTERRGPLAPVRLAYVGAIATQDGVDGLADVLAHLRDRDPPTVATLLVIGDGDGRGQFEAAIARRGVADRVTITGWVAADRVPALLAGADVCVDPARASPLNERSTMIKLGEYLVLGKPTVAYDLLETRRTVGDAALLVADGDSGAFAERITALAADEELRRVMSDRARERARELTWERSEERLLHAYATFARAAGRAVR